MTQDDLLTLIWTARKNWTKNFFIFLKFIILVEIERKNYFNGSNATHII